MDCPPGGYGPKKFSKNRVPILKKVKILKMMSQIARNCPTNFVLTDFKICDLNVIKVITWMIT